MSKDKHSFVDVNPYLVYSPEVEASSEDGSGSGFPVIEFSSNSLQIQAGKLLEMVNISPVLFKYREWDGDIWAFVIKGFISSNNYYFVALEGTSLLRFAAQNADSKPTKTG